MEYHLDLTAYRCPMPLMMTKNALKMLGQDDSLYLKLDRFSALSDIQQLCEKAGCRVVCDDQDSEQIVLKIETKKIL